MDGGLNQGPLNNGPLKIKVGDADTLERELCPAVVCLKILGSSLSVFASFHFFFLTLQGLKSPGAIFSFEHGSPSPISLYV